MKYYLDTEFNGRSGELISLALVADDGREIYLFNYDRSENPIDWVKQNVMPVIAVAGAAPDCNMLEKFGPKLEQFFEGDESPHIMVDWPDDIKYLCDVLVTGPGEMVGVPKMTFELARVDAYPTALPGAVQHNALWDARALRLKLTGKRSHHFDKWQ